MALMAQPDARPGSALEVALERIGDRWSFLVVDALMAGPLRFTDLQQRLPGIAPNVLAGRLRRLEQEGILLGEAYSARPPRLAYELTADGRELAGALRLLADWAGRRAPEGATMRHEVCGTPVEARWYCPTCARPVSEDEASRLDRA